jgi:drug/metabolite transporter (DMT)-like permease
VLLFGETIGRTQIVGAAIILAGIGCLARSETSGGS